MTRLFLALQASSFLLLLALGCAQTSPRALAPPLTAALVAELGQGFASETAHVNGTSLHYVRGGSGPAVVLLHGFPEDWFEYHAILPRLARRFTVVAPDLRGIGESQATPGGYDAATLAEDVHQLAEHLKLDRIYVVGHDLGGMVAYALARAYPDSVRGALILDVPLPGLVPWDELACVPELWHVNFHQTPEIPELLIAGRQLEYFSKHFFVIGTLERSAISEEAATHYAAAYGTPERLRAGMEIYRAFPANAAINAAERGALRVPIVLAGGAASFAELLPRLAEDLRAHGCESVTVEVIPEAAHYVVEEQPDAVAEMIERYASR